MGRRFVALGVFAGLWTVVLVGASGGGIAHARTAVAARIWQVARESGQVRVIARLDTSVAQGTDRGDFRAESPPPPDIGETPESGSDPDGASPARVAIRAARAWLERDLGRTAWRTTRAFSTIPYVALEVAPDALAALEGSGAVLDVAEDRLETVTLQHSVPQIDAIGAQERGLDGAGWAIAILDTGVDASHPWLANRVINEACFSANGSCPNGQSTQIGPGAGAPCDYANGACPHGTHVAGIAAGRGPDVTGVAPGAQIIAIQVFSRFTGSNCDDDVEDPCAKTYTTDSIAALEQVFLLRHTVPIAAVNLSFGGGQYSSQEGCDAGDTARKAVVDNLRAAGIAVVAASGNEGLGSAMTAPACLSSAVSVGAVDSEDRVASFSNSAPFLDFLAPGVRITSSRAGGGTAVISGTSQAAPHVAGAWAILNQVLGRQDVTAVESALRATGLPISDPRTGVVTPRIRVTAAVDALGPPPRQSGIRVTPDSRRNLISKDVGSERWAITYDAADRTVTGNVYSLGGGDPTFVWCERIRDDGNPDPSAVQITFSCFAADACQTASCPGDSWLFVQQVTLPGSFLRPPAASSVAASTGTVAALDATAASAAAVEGPLQGGAGSGVQVTPDASGRRLVSKDVGDERWAITQNADDGTVTGNVFRSSGGTPAFVWCQRLRDDGNPDPAAIQITYSCSGADACTATSCAPSDWTALGERTIPGAFFLP